MTATDNPMPQSIYNEMLKRPHPSGCAKLDLHHAIIGKGDVVGMKLSNRRKIHSVCNLLWLSNADNASHANVPTRARAYEILCAREEKSKVDMWLADMLASFKSPPFTIESLQC